jgi:predicted peptidase
MKLSLLLFILCHFCLNAFSQNIKIERDIIYASVPDWKNRVQKLTMDLYIPSSNKSLPLIVFIHGGGFRVGAKESHTAFCTSLSMQGYVVANINYRIGFDTSETKRDLGILMASYRAAQDASSTLRYLVHNAKELYIDTSSVFIGGESAGAVTSLAGAYITQQEWDQTFPLLHKNLGTINESGNTLTDAYHIKGIISLWGGIVDTLLITPVESKTTPIVLFQSQSDQVIPYQHSKGQGAIFSPLYGSFDIAQRFQSNGSCARLYYTKNARHSFGFSHNYVLSAIKLFVEDVLNGNCKSFIEENNERNDLPFPLYQ